MINQQLVEITDRIEQRSKAQRAMYLNTLDALAQRGKSKSIACSNLAHAVAATPPTDKRLIIDSNKRINLGIVSAYNDMLSAHKPYENYPSAIRKLARKYDASAQMAGATPAMCDGITQGREGMTLSLFSRDIIAMSTSVALSHDVFDGAIMLGICDKIVPGLLIGALQFGHLPTIFIPAGPMTSGLSNAEKKRIRQLFVEKKVSQDRLLDAEMQAYHSAGTCTFYGTANSNQMLLEAMGLHRPNHAFINPSDSIHPYLVEDATKQLIQTVRTQKNAGIGHLVTAKTLVNALIALLSTGGSTNHTIHWIAVARAAGYTITWEDLAQLSHIAPLICQIYPNGSADVNDFQDAGGPAVVIRQLLDAGLMHDDVLTVNGYGLHQQCFTPEIDSQQQLIHKPAQGTRNPEVISPVNHPFRKNGGIQLVQGNLGKAIVKTSSLPATDHNISAPARVFDSQTAVVQAYQEGVFDAPCVVVVRYQSPKHNGMPELHKLMAVLGSAHSKGTPIALLTDGRLSGASGQILSAIHLVADENNYFYAVESGDLITIDSAKGLLHLDVEESVLAKRTVPPAPQNPPGFSTMLFNNMRNNVSAADTGATIW